MRQQDALSHRHARPCYGRRMKRPLLDPEETQPSLYDPKPVDEDLWFAGPDLEDDVLAPPLPRSERTDLLRVAEWRRAEATLAADLARAAQRFGAFEERLRRTPAGVRERLAVLEASELSWWAGDRVTPDRLSLWMSLRLSGAQEDSVALTRAGWAARRLVSGPGPEAGLASFLGRSEMTERMMDWVEIDEVSAGMHPISRAAMGFHGWSQIAGGPGSAQMEAAVVAARAAGASGQSAAFLPLASGGSTALRPGGPPDERLRRWYAGAEQATLSLLRDLDRLDAWRERALDHVASLSGRTAPRLIQALCRWPLLSVQVAEAETGVSRAAVQRNLERLADLGLIREVTGQERFRLWTAAVQK
ncbi:MarR family transcriptional regulator [Cereibacter sphaeroides]